jgi:hypothetical protein
MKLTPAECERLDLLEARLAELQLSDKPTSWYREASVLVAVLALILSMTSAYLSYRQGIDQDAQTARSELGQLIQRYSDLTEDDSYEVGADSGQVTTRQRPADVKGERLVLAGQAADIIRRIPEQVSAHECLLVARFLHDLERHSDSRELAEIGLRKKLDRSTHPSLLNIKANALFKDGRPTEGRIALQEALDAAPLTPPSARNWSLSYIEIYWAALEQRAQNCEEAALHTSRATEIISQLRPESKKQMEQHLKDEKTLCT